MIYCKKASLSGRIPKIKRAFELLCCREVRWMVDRESRDRMAESPVIHHTLRMSQAELASMLAAELINPLYCPETRRSQSVVKSEYVALLDGWFDAGYSRETYPKNSRGSLARI